MGTQDMDLSEFEQLSAPKKRACPLGVALADLQQDESAQLAEALARDKCEITGPAICEWLKRRGHKANIQSVASHRHGTCTCYA